MNSFHSSCRVGQRPSVLRPEMGNFGASCPNGPKRSGHRKGATHKALRRGVPLPTFNGTPKGTHSGAAFQRGAPFPCECVGARLHRGACAPMHTPAHTRDRDTCPAPTLVRVTGVLFRVPLVLSIGLGKKKERERIGSDQGAQSFVDQHQIATGSRQKQKVLPELSSVRVMRTSIFIKFYQCLRVRYAPRITTSNMIYQLFKRTKYHANIK